MNKYKKIIIFSVTFIATAIADFIIFVGLFSNLLTPGHTSLNKFDWILDNTNLSILLFFWMFIGIPSLMAYFIAFSLLKKKTTITNKLTEEIFGKKHFKAAIILTIILGILVIALIRWGTKIRFLPYTFHEIQPGELAEISPSPLSYSSPSLIPTETQPINSTAPLSKFALHIHAIDYSIGQDNGSLPGTTIALFDKAGNKIGQGIQTADEEGQKGKVGSVEFFVPFGQYSYTAQTDTLIRKGEIDASLLGNGNYIFIYLLAKPITIKGRYFVDDNKNRQYDSGEKTFENQKITFFYHSEKLDKIWNAGSTQTGTNGTFETTLYEKWEGEYILGAAQILGYQELPQLHFQAKGGQTINQDVYLWPL